MFIVFESLRIDLNSFSFYTNCCREWILNTCTYFWCFLELFIRKFIPNINSNHVQDYSWAGATFASRSHRRKLPRQGGSPGVVQRVTRLSKLARGKEKLMWTVTGVRLCTVGKFTPRVSELSLDHEMPDDHVNRPIAEPKHFRFYWNEMIIVLKTTSPTVWIQQQD